MHNVVQEIDSPEEMSERTPTRGAVTRTNRREAPAQYGGEHFDPTPLEIKVIALTAAGYSRQERARLLGMSRRTLHLHLLNIYSRLQVEGELEMVLFALYHRLIDTGEKSSPCVGGLPTRV